MRESDEPYKTYEIYEHRDAPRKELMETSAKQNQFLQLRRALYNNGVVMEDSYVSRLAESTVGYELTEKLVNLEDDRDMISERE